MKTAVFRVDALCSWFTVFKYLVWIVPTNFLALPGMNRLMFLPAPYIFQLATSYLYSLLNARLAAYFGAFPIITNIWINSSHFSESVATWQYIPFPPNLQHHICNCGFSFIILSAIRAEYFFSTFPDFFLYLNSGSSLPLYGAQFCFNMVKL